MNHLKLERILVIILFFTIILFDSLPTQKKNKNNDKIINIFFSKQMFSDVNINEAKMNKRLNNENKIY